MVNRNREIGEISLRTCRQWRTGHMTHSKITLEELCEAWRYEHRAVESDHLASSALFDLIHQCHDDEEKRQILRHLAECTACLQNLEAMLKIKGLVLTAEEPFAAAIPQPKN
jgi:hypothetical protein